MAKSKITYDSSKNYGWDPKDKFTISGEQFGILYTALNQEINAPGGATIALKSQAYNVTLDIIRKSVVRGKMKEVGAVATVETLSERADAMFPVREEESTPHNNEESK